MPKKKMDILGLLEKPLEKINQLKSIIKLFPRVLEISREDKA